jgi:hypothetical protein
MNRKQSNPIINSEFVITGDNFDPSECTKIIGLVPTQVISKGEKRIKGSTLQRTVGVSPAANAPFTV